VFQTLSFVGDTVSKYFAGISDSVTLCLLLAFAVSIVVCKLIEVFCDVTFIALTVHYTPSLKKIHDSRDFSGPKWNHWPTQLRVGNSYVPHYDILYGKVCRACDCNVQRLV